MPSSDDTSFIQKLCNLLGLDADEATQKVGGLDVDNAIELVSAVSAGDAQRANTLLNSASLGDSGTDEAVGDDEAKQVTDTDDSLDIEAEHNFAFGDNVIADGKPGVVKVPRTNKGKIGVLVDGKLNLFEPGDVEPSDDTLSEDVSRILTLSGIRN